jgi:diadenosine tetraphosphate (Ap4A) HIT family hydrolase
MPPWDVIVLANPSPSRTALFKALDAAKAIIEKDHRPDGYNIGINYGAAAGQTIFHLHVHLIPRY